MQKVTLTIEPLPQGMLKWLANFSAPQTEAARLLQAITQDYERESDPCRCGSAVYEDADGDFSCPFCMSGAFDDDELMDVQLREAERQTIIATLVALDKAMVDGLHTWQFTKALGDYEK